MVQTKKPVIREEYDELVFFQPAEAFHGRVSAVPPAPAALSREIGLEAQLPKYHEETELNQLLVARTRIAEQRARLQAQLEAADPLL